METTATIESFKEPEYPSSYPSLKDVVAAAKREMAASEGVKNYYKSKAKKRFRREIKNEKTLIEKGKILEWIQKAYEEGYKDALIAAGIQKQS